MDNMEQFRKVGVVPVVVLEHAEQAVDTAKALLAGGINVMEITMRTDAALESIRRVSASCPDMLVGAGTVLTLEQGKACVEAGAKFIVSPGYDPALVAWCMEKNVPVLPGCVTPTEIMAGLQAGVKIFKFFPSNIYGGIKAMKALSGPFPGIKFIPTGGVNEKNLGEFIAAPFIHAVGGSWVCAKKDIAEGNFEKITALCKQARSIALGFELAHVGVNCEDADKAMALCQTLEDAFGMAAKVGNSSIFAGTAVEAMKTMYLGANGHIGLKTNSVDLAVAELQKKGFTVNESTVKYKGDRMSVAYFNEDFGGFAIHVVQK